MNNFLKVSSPRDEDVWIRPDKVSYIVMLEGIYSGHKGCARIYFSGADPVLTNESEVVKKVDIAISGKVEKENKKEEGLTREEDY